MADKTVWVLTYEANDYNQHGEYLFAVFLEKPTVEELGEKKGITGDKAKDLVENGLHRERCGDIWCLREDELL